MGWRIAFCDECKTEDLFTVMLHDNLWLSIANKRDVLCVNCIEKRLGRKLTLDDLRPCEATRGIQFGYAMAKG